MLGVRPPIMPRWYALMFQTPMSSPKITRMFGKFFCWADAYPAAKTKTANNNVTIR